MTAPIRVVVLASTPEEATASALAAARDRFECRVETGADGVREAVVAGDADCVVCRHDPPAVDGLACLETVRAEDPDLPAVLVCEERSDEALREGLAMGADDAIPITSAVDHGELLASRIERVVDRLDRLETLERRYEVLDSAQDIAEFGAAEYDAVADEIWLSEGMYRHFEIERPPDGTTYEGTDRETAMSYYHPDDRETVAEAYERALVEGESSEVEVRHTPGNEWVRVQCEPRFDDDGEVTGFLALVQDITNRKGRERELERYELLLDLMPDTVVVTDLEGTVHEVHGFEGWSGYDYDDVVESHMSFNMTDESVEQAEETVADLIFSDDRDKATFEMEIEMADGQIVPFEDHITLLPPDEDGEIPGTMSVLRDITDRIERERELERQNDRLEEFASIASHDLRNPLNLAQGYLEMVDADCDSKHTDDVAQALDRMEKLIDDTLTWAKQGATVAERRPVDLGEIAPEGWNAVGGDGSLEVIDPVQVLGDPGRVRQLLENLVRNAHEHAGPEPTVRVGALPDGFYVEDDGPGIPESDRESVFGTGYSTATDGTGFGLAIVAEIAEAHGWDVAVTESADGGARFEFTGVERADED